MIRFACALAAPMLLPLAASAEAGTDVSGFYAGTLGDDLKVTVSLRQSDNAVEGYYHYDKHGVDIRLEGAVSPDGEVSLVEFGPFEITAMWQGRFSDGAFAGWWRAVDGRHVDVMLAPVSLAAEPGEPVGRRVAFGAIKEDIPIHREPVPGGIATHLIPQLVEAGEIDPDNGDHTELVALAETDPAQLFLGERLDLDGDGTPELAVRASGETGACTTQNCGFWIFRQQDGGYVEILSDMVGYSGYTVLNQSHGGLLDLAVSQHYSAAETAYAIFRFDGAAYRQATCVLKTYEDETTFTYTEPCP